ncbi:hypothetical protein EYR36_002870 [Pleurotus pulmonarius]|nr:hypothetical protein EYR36_002870 [Pleurotus pulmonarius]
MATTIVRQYASRQPIEEMAARDTESQDQQLRQQIMWNADVLVYIELRDAIRSGDVGRMEDITPTLLLRFAGGGNSNYTIELLEMMQGMYKEWPPAIVQYVKRNCWLFTRTGEPNSWLPYDLGQEENIGDIKVNYQAQGPGGTMEYLSKYSPAIPALRQVKETVNNQFAVLKGRGKRHGVPDKEADVAKLTASYMESSLYSETPGRRIKGAGDRADDYVSKGGTNLLESHTIPDWFAKRTYTRATTEDWDTSVD